MNWRSYLYFLSLLVFLGFMACSGNMLINQNEPIGDSWVQDKSIHFDFEILDTVSSYSFYLNIRNTIDYRFSNLYLFIDTQMPNGNQTRDTIECILADLSGKWIGNGMGEIKENSILLRNNLLFPVSGEYSIEFTQAMRVESLEGIKDIGIKFEKNPN